MTTFQRIFDVIPTSCAHWVHIGFVIWGWVPVWWLISQGGNLCVWKSPLHYLGYTLEWSLVFGAHLCWGGGNVTFHGIYMFSAGILYHWVSAMHLWATLGCGVFSCHSNLVNHVRGSMSAPSVKSVAHRALCA